jgi:hypothetical protein
VVGRLVSGAFVAWSLVASAWAAPTLQVVAEPPTLLVGQSGTLHVMVVSEGGAGAEVARGRTPSVPTEDGVELRYRGMGSGFHADGTRLVSVVTYQYGLDALAEGAWLVGPVEVKLADGSTITANPVRIDVKPRSNAAPTGDAFRVSAGFVEEQAWEGQLLLYQYELETTLPGVRASWRLPLFEALRQPQNGAPTETTYQVQDGDATITTVRGTVPLIATGVGEIDIGVAVAAVDIPFGNPSFGGWRNQRQERRATEPESLIVRKLPSPPDDFSGVVGDVVVQAKLERNKAAVGESVALQVVVQSDGSLEGLAPPDYEPTGVSVYDDGSKVTGQVTETGYRGIASFRRVLVPVEPGSIVLPKVRLVTFSPTKGDYVVHEIEVGTLVATPGREGTGDIESFAGEIDEAPVEESVELKAPWTWGFATTPRIGLAIPLLLGMAAAPGLLALSGQGLAAMRRRWKLRQLAEVGPPSPFSFLRGMPSDEEGRLAAYDAALRQALANRMQIDVGALDREAAIATLPAPVAKDVSSLIRGLDSVRYGGHGFSDGLDAVVRRVIAAVEKA